MAETPSTRARAVTSGLMGRGRRIAQTVGTLRLVTTGLILLLALLLARYSWNIPVVVNVESFLYDFRSAAATRAVPQDDRIALVVYDDETLRLTGKRSPLDRTVLAKALTRLDAMGAKSIGIDILIDQPQPEDPVLIDAFKSMKTPVWLAYASNATNPDKITYDQQQFVEAWMKAVVPGNVRSTSIRLEAEEDDVLRRWPPRPPGLPPAMPNAMIGADPKFDTYEGSVSFRRSNDAQADLFTTIPIQTFAEDAVFAIPEAAEALAQPIRGRHVLIGGHIQDIDLFQTPLRRLTGKPTWGMDVFAHMLAQQLDGRRFVPLSDWVLWLAALVAVGAGGATALAAFRPSITALALVAQLGAMFFAPYLLHDNLIETFGLPQFGWSAGWLFAFTAVGTAARAVGSQQRKFAQNALGKYLPRDIAAEILRNPDGLALHGEKREIFVLFTDLEGFTKLSHAIEPEMVATLLNRYLEMLSDVVLEHGGTIDKFVGDAVVAFWGAPISRPDDGERAARAALAMHQAGEEFRNTVPDGVPAIGKTRVGLHHGEAIVGNFGGEGRIQYTALGDSMNTAARLESANKQTKTSVLVSREAAELSGLDWYRSMGRIVLRGRATPVDIMEPRPDLDSAERAAFGDIVERARKGDAEAARQLGALTESHPNDAALRNLVYRITNQAEGGYFVLD